MTAGSSKPMVAHGEGEEQAQRRRLRRFGLVLLAIVIALVGLTVGYVELFDRVLRDPERPPTVAFSRNPRVIVVELALGAVLLVAITAFVIRRRGRRSR